MPYSASVFNAKVFIFLNACIVLVSGIYTLSNLPPATPICTTSSTACSIPASIHLGLPRAVLWVIGRNPIPTLPTTMPKLSGMMPMAIFCNSTAMAIVSTRVGGDGQSELYLSGRSSNNLP